MKRFKIFLAVLCLSLFIFQFVYAQQKTDKWLNSPGTGEYPGFDAVILSDYVGYDVFRNRTTALTEHEVIKILTPEGVKKLGKVIRTYVKPYQKIEIKKACIIKPDGTIVNLDPKKEILFKYPYAKDVPFLSNFGLLVLDFSKAKVGDIIEYHIVTYDKKPMIKKYFWTVSFVNDEFPMVKTTLVVNMHRDAYKLHWLTVRLKGGNLKPQIRRISGGYQYKWVLKNRKGIKREPASPPVKDLGAYIMVSTCPSWKDMSCAYFRVFEPYIKGGEKTKALAEKLVKGKKTPKKKVYAIAKYIWDRRKINFGFFPERLMLRNPDGIISSKKNITLLDAEVLFVALLRSAGFEAYPALIADQKFGKVERDLPSPYQFNRVIAYVKIGKDWKYVDATSAFSHSLDLYAGLEGRGVLPLTPRGANLDVTPITPAYKNMEKVVTTAELTEDGSIGVRFLLTESGKKKIFIQALFAAIKNASVEGRAIERLVKMIAPNAIILSFERREVPEKDTFEMEIAFMAKDYPEISGDYWIVPMPLIPTGESRFTRIPPSERKYPVLLGSTSQDVKTLQLTIPEGFEFVSYPPNVNMVNKVGSLKVDCKVEKNKLYYTYRFRLNKLFIPVSEYKDLYDLFKKAVKVSKEVIIIKKPEAVGESS